MPLSGHYWTLRQYFSTLRAPGLPGELSAWEHGTRDARGSEVQLTGRVWHRDTDELLVVLHGLGGSVDSRYMPRAFAAARAQGLACLLLNARGAGNTSGGVSHAGLSDDVALALSAPCLERYRSIYLFGYSMGGHVGLRYASLAPDPRLKSVVAVCSPLKLRASMQAFDRARFSVYRRHVLKGLVDSYQKWANQHPVPVAVAELRKIDKIFEWDARVVAPMFGFASAWDYYEQASAASTLHQLKVPALYIGTRHDPMVPPCTVTTALASASAQLEVRWSEVGGHLAFPRSFSLGVDATAGLELEAVRWLQQAPARPRATP